MKNHPSPRVIGKSGTDGSTMHLKWNHKPFNVIIKKKQD